MDEHEDTAYDVMYYDSEIKTEISNQMPESQKPSKLSFVTSQDPFWVSFRLALLRFTIVIWLGFAVGYAFGKGWL